MVKPTKSSPWSMPFHSCRTRVEGLDLRSVECVSRVGEWQADWFASQFGGRYSEGLGDRNGEQKQDASRLTLLLFWVDGFIHARRQRAEPSSIRVDLRCRMQLVAALALG